MIEYTDDAIRGEGILLFPSCELAKRLGWKVGGRGRVLLTERNTSRNWKPRSSNVGAQYGPHQQDTDKRG